MAEPDVERGAYRIRLTDGTLGPKVQGFLVGGVFGLHAAQALLALQGVPGVPWESTDPADLMVTERRVAVGEALKRAKREVG